MGWIRRKLDQAAVRRFYTHNSTWLRARRTHREIAGAFAEHPIWRRVSNDLRSELSERLTSAKDHFTSFDAEHAFEVVAGTTDMCDVLHQNIIPIDGNRSHTTADKCWLIAETFRKIGSKGIGEVIQAGHTIDEQVAVNALTTSTLCLEAAVCIDHYKLDAMPLMALAWVYRSKDFSKAHRIMNEVETLIPTLSTQNLHPVGYFGRAQIASAAEIVNGIRMVRENIEQIRASVA